jgi:hypothetical protein
MNANDDSKGGALGNIVFGKPGSAGYSIKNTMITKLN